MTEPYLIQTAKFLNREHKKGVDSLLIFDYMGSAEFEFGALPKSLKRVRENISKYTQFQYSFKKYPSKIVTVFCKEEDSDYILEALEGLSENKFILKEYCDLSKWVKSSTGVNKNDFWWDIENDFFFWKHNTEFDLKFKLALKNN